jgi:hypothetical protein
MAESPQGGSLSIFLSYASEQTRLAERIHLRLTGQGHRVFFDRTSLAPGREYDLAILREIRSSDLMVFLICPNSIVEGAYARTELRYAQDSWPAPEGRVLPVMAEATDFEMIPEYLKAVTILRPEGDVAAEVAAAVHDLVAGKKPGWTVDDQLSRMGDRAEELRVDLQLAELDRDWERARAKYFPSGDSSDPAPLPWAGSREDQPLSRVMIVLPLVVGIGFSLIEYSSRWRMFESWIGVVAPALIGIVIAVVWYNGIQDYNEEWSAHRRRRSTLIARKQPKHRFFRDL